MTVLIDFIQHIGHSSLAAFWFPVLVWSLLSLATWGVLNCFKKREPLLQYHLRVGLVGALPAGFAVMLATNLLSSESATLARNLQAAFITIPHPAPTHTADAPASAIPFLAWSNMKLMLGTLTIVFGIASLLTVIRLLRSYKHLHHFTENAKTYHLHEITDLPGQEHHREITVVFSALVEAPFTYTLGKPVIILPAALRDDLETVRTILLHELIHIQRADFLLYGLLHVVKSVFWFHPLIHRYAREAEEYREIACDARVLAKTAISKRQYARLLYLMTTSRESSRLSAVSLSHNHSLLKKRIEFMKTSMHSTTWFPIKKCVVLSLILLTSIAGFIGCTKLQGPVTPLEESATASDNYLTVYLGESDLLTVNGNQSTLTDFDRTLKKNT